MVGNHQTSIHFKLVGLGVPGLLMLTTSCTCETFEVRNLLRINFVSSTTHFGSLISVDQWWLLWNQPHVLSGYPGLCVNIFFSALQGNQCCPYFSAHETSLVSSLSLDFWKALIWSKPTIGIFQSRYSLVFGGVDTKLTRWLFSFFFKFFIPIWGNDPIWLTLFRRGWNHQPVNQNLWFFNFSTTLDYEPFLRWVIRW